MARPVRLAESVARIGDRERAVALPRDLEPIGRRMGGGGAAGPPGAPPSRRRARSPWRRRTRTPSGWRTGRTARRWRRRGEHAGDGLVVVDVRDEHTGRVVFDADVVRPVQLP